MSADQSNKNSRPRVGLSSEDVQALLVNPVPGQRAKIVTQLAVDFDSGRLSPAEWQMALEIMRAMASDAEQMVRVAVAESLKHSDSLPRDLAVKLAKDDIVVAQPILENSHVLTDDDLISILADGNGAKQVSIARRPVVSEVVASAIIDTGNAAAVSTLVSNEGAALTEPLLKKTLDRYAKFETVKAAMVHRTELPVTITERLVSLVSEKLKLTLAARHKLPVDVATDIILDARERATVGLLSKGTSNEDNHALVQQLHASGRLTSSLVLRALCSGDVRFVEDAMAEIAGTSADKASLLIHDAGKLGLKALYAKCGFPQALYPAFRVAVDVIDETGFDGGDHDRERFARRVIERVLTQYQDIDVSDLDYLLGKLKRLEAA
jgi:uncharacterized protein (DUF2336 family)